MTYSQEPAGQPGRSGNRLIDRLPKPLAKALARGDLVGHSGASTWKICFRQREECGCLGWDNWVWL